MITTLSRLGLVLVLLGVLAAAAAPVLAPHATDDRFPGLLNAPPTLPHVIDSSVTLACAVHLSVAARRIDCFSATSAMGRLGCRWCGSPGRAVTSSDDAGAPLLLLGADSYGRDVFSRLLFGARVSLGLAIVAALGSMSSAGSSAPSPVTPAARPTTC